MLYIKITLTSIFFAILLIGIVPLNNYLKEKITRGLLLLGLFTSIILAWRYNSSAALLICAFIIFLVWQNKYNEEGCYESLPLLIASLLGAVIIISSTSLISFYIGLELQSIPLYILAALAAKKNGLIKSALRYFIISAFASILILIGISYLEYCRIAMVTLLGSSDHLQNLLIAGGTLLITGIAIKIALVPLHLWVKDTYRDISFQLILYISVIPKLSLCAFLCKLPDIIALNDFTSYSFSLLIIVLSTLSMIVGAIGLLRYNDVKGFLGYSSILNIGYITFIIGGSYNKNLKESGFFKIAALDKIINFYFYAYVASLVIFIIIARLVSYAKDNEESNIKLPIAMFSGLAKIHPWLAGCISVSVFSLIGIPPLAGFFGKMNILLFWFSMQGFYGIAIIMGIVIALSAYPYLKIVKTIYFDDGMPVLIRKTTLLENISLVMALIIILLSFCFYRIIMIYI